MSIKDKVRRYITVTPTTIQALQGITGHSYNGIKAALSELDAEVVPGSWPRKYFVSEPTIEEVREGAVFVQIEEPDIEGWALRRVEMADRVSTLSIDPDGKPSEQAEKFLDIARELLSIAYVIDKNKKYSDWYEIITKQW